MSQKVYEVEVKTWVTDEACNRKLDWVVMPVVKARQLADPTIRCEECHGRVKLMSAGPGGVPAAHAEHFQRFTGCSLGDCYDGTSRPNPSMVL
jgi:uncharacterized protein with PIN domain